MPVSCLWLTYLVLIMHLSCPRRTWISTWQGILQAFQILQLESNLNQYIHLLVLSKNLSYPQPRALIMCTVADWWTNNLKWIYQTLSGLWSLCSAGPGGLCLTVTVALGSLTQSKRQCIINTLLWLQAWHGTGVVVSTSAFQAGGSGSIPGCRIMVIFWFCCQFCMPSVATLQCGVPHTGHTRFMFGGDIRMLFQVFDKITTSIFNLLNLCSVVFTFFFDTPALQFTAF